MSFRCNRFCLMLKIQLFKLLIEIFGCFTVNQKEVEKTNDSATKNFKALQRQSNQKLYFYKYELTTKLPSTYKVKFKFYSLLIFFR